MCPVQEGLSDQLSNLKRFAFSLVGAGRVSEADDLVQNCVLRALEKADQFEAGTNLKAWLFTLMRNLFISERRHEQMCRRHAAALLRGTPLVSLPRQYHHVLLRQTAKAMKKLSREEIGYIRDIGLAAKSHAEVAAGLNVPEGTMKSRLSRSRIKLRRIMGEEDAPN